MIDKAPDRRVVRTRTKVVDAAREIVAELGVVGLTYTALAARSGVSRPTLYQHWPTLPELLLELMHHPPDEIVAPARSPQEVLEEFVRTFQDSMADAASGGVFVSLLAQAERDPAARGQLRGLSAARLGALNDQVAPFGLVATERDLASLIGPPVFWRFVLQKPLSREDITALASSVLAQLRPA